MLTRYLAGECRSYEVQNIERHLADCPSCASEMQKISQLDGLLDLWQTGSAPGDLWDGIMSEVSQTTPLPEPGARQVTSCKLFGQLVFANRPVQLLRDLAVAAAVSLAIFWNAGAWFTGGQMLAAGKSINGTVAAYTQVADTALERAAGTAGEYTRKIIFEEWKQR